MWVELSLWLLFRWHTLYPSTKSTENFIEGTFKKIKLKKKNHCKDTTLAFEGCKIQ